MAPLLDNIRNAMTTPRGGRPVCMVCGRGISSRDAHMRLRGGGLVHRVCATYDMRRRRTGDDRLGFPPRG